MGFVRNILTIWLGLSASVFAQQYVAKVTVKSGSSFVVESLKIEGDRLYTGAGRSFMSLAMIRHIEFRFFRIDLKMCEEMFMKGKQKTLEHLLEVNVGPVSQYCYLPTNLSAYLFWLLKVQYWNKNRSGAEETFEQIRQSNDSGIMDAAALYSVMLLLDQGKADQARIIFSEVENPEAVSVPMAEYIRGRLALEEGTPRQAMRHVARILAFYSRDIEWMPPATLLEAHIYQRFGQPEKAAMVARELIMAYPDTQWSRIGKEFEMKSNEPQGG